MEPFDGDLVHFVGDRVIRVSSGSARVVKVMGN
jgi:hypothetical protein